MNGWRRGGLFLGVLALVAAAVAPAGAQVQSSNRVELVVVVNGVAPPGSTVTMSVGCTVESGDTPPPGGWPAVELTAVFELRGDLTPQGIEVPMPVATGEVLCDLQFLTTTGIPTGTSFEDHIGCTGNPGTAPWPHCIIGPHPPWNIVFPAPGSGAVVNVVQTFDFPGAAPEAVAVPPSFTG